jgi:hypothetical protein
MNSTGIFSSPKGKKGAKVNFVVSPDVPETNKSNEKRERIETNQESLTICDSSKNNKLDQQSESKTTHASKLQERKTREKISIISPQLNKNAPTDSKMSYEATDLCNFFGDDNIVKDVGKVIEIIGLDANRRGILIDKSCTIKDVIEREKNITVTNKKIFLIHITNKDEDAKCNDKDIAYKVLDIDIPYYLQIEL